MKILATKNIDDIINFGYKNPNSYYAKEFKNKLETYISAITTRKDNRKYLVDYANYNNLKLKEI